MAEKFPFNMEDRKKSVGTYEDPVSFQEAHKERYAKSDPVSEKVFSMLKTERIKGADILDLAAGTGDHAVEFIEKGANAVFAIDIKQGMISHGKETVKKELAGKIYFITGDMTNIPLKDSSIDIAHIRFGLQYLRDIDKAYSEVYRVLKPEGEMIFVVPHPDDSFARFNKNPKPDNMVEVEIYPGKIVEYPLHIYDDYISGYFCSHFNQIDIKGLKLDPANSISTDVLVVHAHKKSQEE